MKRAVLVNGVPASGKSTVARLVSDRFGWPLFALDAIKEPFFAELGTGDRDYNRKLGRSAYAAIFNTIAGFPDGQTVVVEAWFGFQPAEVLARHLDHAGVGEAVELWCHAPPAEIARRYADRVALRAAGHPGLDYVPELLALAGRAQPIGAGPLFPIDTTRTLDLAGVDRFLEDTGLVSAREAGNTRSRT
jgi:glucokinase